MSATVQIPSFTGLLLLSCLAALGCKRKAEAEADQPAPEVEPLTTTASGPASKPPAIAFDAVDPSALSTRGAPSGMEGRFSSRPAVVASPCGFHLVVSETNRAWTTLLVGHELAWTKEDAPLLLKLDGLILDVGLIDDRTMGALLPLPADRLLTLTGQWETTWLSRDADVDNLPVKENARGQAHLEPHPSWRVWSTTLGGKGVSAGVATSHAVIATVVLDQRVLVLRALLDREELARRALARLVFAVDSLETRPTALGKREFTETLAKAAAEDPTCATIHDAHDDQLE